MISDSSPKITASVRFEISLLLSGVQELGFENHVHWPELFVYPNYLCSVLYSNVKKNLPKPNLIVSNALPRVFISHASEDKFDVARPLAKALQRMNISVWYDEFSLSVGDSLRTSIDRGLSLCHYGVVILSKHFFAKTWTRSELDGLTTKEMQLNRKIIFPVWHKVNSVDVAAFSPMLAGKLGITTRQGIRNLAKEIKTAIENEDALLGVRKYEFQSPFGGQFHILGIANSLSSMGPLQDKKLNEVFTVAKAAAEQFFKSEWKKKK